MHIVHEMLNFSFEKSKHLLLLHSVTFLWKNRAKIVTCPKISSTQTHLVQLFAFNYCYFIVLHLSGWIIHTLKCIENRATTHIRNFQINKLFNGRKMHVFIEFGSLFFFFVFSFLTYVLSMMFLSLLHGFGACWVLESQQWFNLYIK